MKGKLALLLGGAVGYVLGTRDGRQRYEQIKGKAEELWSDPKVQQKVGEARQTATDGVRKAAGSTKSAVSGSPNEPSGSGPDVTPTVGGHA